LVLVGEISPKNPNFFPSGQKKLLGLNQRWISVLFIAGQKYARVGSGLISSDLLNYEWTKFELFWVREQ